MGCLAPGADPKSGAAIPFPEGDSGSATGTAERGATTPTTTTGSGPETEVAPGSPGVAGSATTAVSSAVRVERTG